MRRFAVGLVGFALLAAAGAGALEPKKASEIVVLSLGSAPCVNGRLADLPAGTPFVVPEKKVLVVTGFSWLAGGLSAGTTATSTLALASGPVLVRSTTVASISLLAGSENPTLPEMVVPSGDSLCVGIPGNTDLAFATIQGFLAPDK